MLKKIQQFFESHFSMTDTSSGDVAHQVNLAAAALLVEMTMQDEQVETSETEAVKAALNSVLGLSADEANELYQLAEEEKHKATDYHQFTRLIAEHYTQPQKVQLIEALWRIAYADNVLDSYEEHMVRRISDLIYVSHKDFIQAKHRVQDELS